MGHGVSAGCAISGMDEGWISGERAGWLAFDTGSRSPGMMLGIANGGDLDFQAVDYYLPTARET